MVPVQLEGPRLEILNGLRVAGCRGSVLVPEGCKRVVAFVALHHGRVERRRVAACLWPDVEGHRAAGNLRSAIWRLRTCGIDVLRADSATVYIPVDVDVDVDRVRAWAGRVVSGHHLPDDLEIAEAAVHALDLLPGWYDDWLVAEREDLRMQVLAAIDSLSGLLVAAGRWGDAVLVALTAVGVDPLRESSQRALIRAHLAEGNRCEATRSLMAYEVLLRRELGADPSRELVRLVRPGVPISMGARRPLPGDQFVNASAGAFQTVASRASELSPPAVARSAASWRDGAWSSSSLSNAAKRR